MRYCSKSLRKNSSKLRFVTMLLQVYKYFFCSKTNRPSLLWVEFGICIGRESSNVLNKISLFESCTFSLWYLLNQFKVLEKNSFDSLQYKKVCSIESGVKHKGHLSSEADLYFCSSFFVVIILYTTLKVNCLSLLSFEGLHIYSQNNHPNQEVMKSFFSKPLLRRVLKQVSRWTNCNNFYSGIWLRLLFYHPLYLILNCIL